MAVKLATTDEERETELEGLPPEQRRTRELIRGAIVLRPEPSAAQRELTDLVFRVVDGFVAARGLGIVRRDADVWLDPYDVLIPDLAYLPHDRTELVGPNGIKGAPDLVVEVTSPELRQLDYVRKHAIYATSGVREYWYVDPGARLFVPYELVGGRYEPISQADGKVPSYVLPGLVVDVGALFFGPPDREFGPGL